MLTRHSHDAVPADVLVIGGGLAGCWAAIAAAREGAQVVLAEKGWCGSSGVTATAGPGHWWVPPGAEMRADAVARRAASGLGLCDPEWMMRVLDTTWRTLPTLSRYYDFPKDEHGTVMYRALRGPEYLRALRAMAQASNVAIMDHAAALDLLRHADGSAAGARLWRRRAHAPLTVHAGAVVLATGGCAFGSHLLGAANNTGDGLLMAAEAGVALSGMEFTGYYTVAPAHTTMTRSMSYAFATYFDAAGQEIPIRPGPPGTQDLARALTAGRVFCHLARMPKDLRDGIHRISPNVTPVFDRLGIDPYRDRFEVTLHGEGTVRGTGGLTLADASCQTVVPGLFAAGDVTSREPVAGATSGGGAQNSAWALSTGVWAGQGAALRAMSVRGRSKDRGQPSSARPHPAVGDDTARAIRHTVRDEMLNYDRNLFRSRDSLRRSRDRLDILWDTMLHEKTGDASADPVRAREALALVAAGRWSWNAALARTESRGLHSRIDAPATDPALARRLAVGGIDNVWARFDQASTTPERAA